MKTLSKRGPHPLSQFQKVLNVNAIGSFNVIRLVAEQMTQGETLNESGEKGIRTCLHYSQIYSFQVL